MATATKERRHSIRPGEVCGHCSLRAPPVHRCGSCRREVPDWPTDEIGWLETNGWTLGSDGMWLEAEERVMRDPTPEMITQAMNLVSMLEAQPQDGSVSYTGIATKKDKFHAEELRNGLEKARKRLASLRAGEKHACRPRMRLSQSQALQAEYVRTHDYDPRTKDRDVPAYTEAQLKRWTDEAKARKGGVLQPSDADIIQDRRERTITEHKSMCQECRRY